MIDVYSQIVEIGKRDGTEEALVSCTALAAGYYGVENDVQEYIEEHPDATVEEISKFIDSIIPPMEIVEDREE